MLKRTALVAALVCACAYSQKVDLEANTKGTLPVARGGTSAANAAGARAALGAAASGANSDITSLSGLSTPLSVAQGGTGRSFAINAASVDYDFAAQAPGGELTAGVPATVTLSPVPEGVNGTDASHYLYISGGAGVAEAVLITGGTAVSGAASGTVTFIPANNHTGAWTIKSATAGIQEAINSIQSKGIVSVPAGTHKMYAPATIYDSLTLSCDSASAALQAQTGAQNTIVVRTTDTLQRVRIERCAFPTAVVKTAGDAIEVNGTGAVSNYGTIIDGVSIQAQYNGIHFASATHWSVVNPLILASTNYSIHIQNTIAPDSGDSSILGGLIDNSVMTGTAIRYDSGGGLKIANVKILNHAVAIDLQVPDGVSTSDLNIANNSIENFVTAGIRLNRAGTTGTFLSAVITGNQMACAAGVGIGTNAGISGVVITGNLISCTNGTAISIANDRATITGNYITANPGTGIATAAGGTNAFIAHNNMVNVATPYSFAVAPRLLDNQLGFVFAALPAVAPGSSVFCTDCAAGAVCAGGGSGVQALLNYAGWTCN